MNTQFKLDKEKYIQIARTQGVQTALTALHGEITGWEYQSFEGVKGWQPEMWEELEKVRKFSRELWEIDLRK